MSFAARMTRSPLAFDPALGAHAAAQFDDLAPELRELIGGTAGSSPYLAGLIAREATWLRETLAGEPETALEAELSVIPAFDAEGLGPGLRGAKRRVALLAALADLGGVWPLEAVTGALTRLADAATDAALRARLITELRRGRIPGHGEEAMADCAGMVVFAMGKMGAHELNYSSDIDLICLFDETRFTPTDAYEARAAFIRATRGAMALLSDLTDEGYVFRTDLRLRPDPSSTPICLGMEAAERYYESLGRTWERAAWIKARPCAGDMLGSGTRFMKALTPFVWRRHLDFAAIRDAHDMRLRIREHKRLHGMDIDGHDLKLGAGGIREIEFFTQTRQLIAGGRDPSLRVRGTVDGLTRLTEAGWIPAETRDELTADYRFHREIEHRVQMVADQQTHALPATPEGWDRLARLMGQGNTGTLRAEIAGRLVRVHELTEGFFAPDRAAATPSLSPEMAAVVERWLTYPALRTTRARDSFERVKPQFLERLTRAAKPEEALLALDSFLKGLPAGAQLFALFEASPQLVDLLVDIAATSPDLARYLSRNAAVLDAVIAGRFFAAWPGEAALSASLAARLADAPDYEKKLDAARVWQREWHFRVGVHHLRGLIGAEEAGKQYAELAAASVAAVFPEVAADFATRHGPPPGRGAAALGMGSLGAGLLTAGSDLDLIVIYDPAGQDLSEGRRPLAARQYYARLTQALVTAISAPMAEGRIYEVDMRLRPSGRQGPVATSLDSFCNYQTTEAWTWEHLALTRARVVAVAGEGGQALSSEVEAFRRDLLSRRGGRERDVILADVAGMRERLFEAKPSTGGWDAKRGPGAMTDIELAAETAALLAGSAQRGVASQLRAVTKAGLLAAPEGALLASVYRLLWSVQACSRLLTDRPLDPADTGEGGRAMLLRETGVDDLDALLARLASARAEAAALVAKALGCESS